MCEFCEKGKIIKHDNVELNLYGNYKIPIDLWITGRKLRIGLFGVKENYDSESKKKSTVSKIINFCPICGRNLTGE